MIKQLAKLWGFSVITQSLLAQGAAIGSIAGTIVGDNGAPVAGATVTCRRASILEKGKNGRIVVRVPSSEVAVKTGTDGFFQVKGLSEGLYHLCPSTTRRSEIGDCGWEEVPSIALANGQAVSGIVRRVHDGTILTIVVNDPNGKIQAPDSRGNDAFRQRFLIGLVDATKRYNAVPLVSPGAVQKIYQLTIPKQRSFRLFVDTAYDVTDNIG